MKSTRLLLVVFMLTSCTADARAQQSQHSIEHASAGYEPGLSGGTPTVGCNSGCDSGCTPCEDECNSSRRSCFFAGAEYLHLRTHFSEAVAFATVTDSLSNQGFNRQVVAHELDFDYENSFRVFLGYHLNECCDVRFSYWQLDTETFVTGTAGVGQTIVDPFGNLGLGGSSINTTASVNMEVYDIEFQRPVDFSCGGIGFLYSAGVRFADVDQFYGSTITGAASAVTSDGRFDVDFSGVGPLLSITGQSFHGGCKQFSFFAKGATALLVGQYDISTRVTQPGVTGGQAADRVRMAPVLESELGASWRPADCVQFSAGWMFQAWFNLAHPEGRSTENDCRLALWTQRSEGLTTPISCRSTGCSCVPRSAIDSARRTSSAI